MKQQYAPWIRDAVPIGFEATYVGVYLASDVEASIVELEAAFQASALLSGEVIEDRNKRIAELERLLDVERRALAAEKEHAERLDKQVLAACSEIEELDKALHEILEEEENEPRAGAIARKALGL